MTRVIRGSDGKRFYTPTEAARLLGKGRRHIETLVEKGELKTVSAEDLLAQVQGRGRRPTYLVEADAIDKRRSELLSKLGVQEELDQLRRERDECRDSWDREAIPLRTRIEELEQKLASVLSAIDQRLEATAAQARADQEFVRTLRKDAGVPPTIEDSRTE